MPSLGRREAPRPSRTVEAAEPERDRVLVLLGPTAVGKSRVAIEVARRLDGEVISADSRTFFRGLDIATDKIPVIGPAGRPAPPDRLGRGDRPLRRHDLPPGRGPADPRDRGARPCADRLRRRDPLPGGDPARALRRPRRPTPTFGKSFELLAPAELHARLETVDPSGREADPPERPPPPRARPRGARAHRPADQLLAGGGEAPSLSVRPLRAHAEERGPQGRDRRAGRGDARARTRRRGGRAPRAEGSTGRLRPSGRSGCARRSTSSTARSRRRSSRSRSCGTRGRSSAARWPGSAPTGTSPGSTSPAARRRTWRQRSRRGSLRREGESARRRMPDSQQRDARPDEPGPARGRPLAEAAGVLL